MKRSLRETHRRQRGALDTEASSSPPFHKQPWFLGLSATVVLVASITGIATGIFGIIKPDSLPKKFPQNVEIVLDRSIGMDQIFDGSKKKIEAAAHATTMLLRDHVLASTNLALREFGGSCHGRIEQPALSFRPNNREAVGKAVEGLKPQGEATLFYAVLEAINDFSDPARFEGVEKEIIVIVGNEDACQTSASPVPGPSSANVHNALLKQGNKSAIKLDFQFIGVGLGEQGKIQLQALAEATNGTPHFAANFQELNDQIHGLVEATQRAADSVVSILQDSVRNLNPVISNIQKADYADAEENLVRANVEFKESEVRFQNLGKLYDDNRYYEIYKAARSVRELQGKLIEIAGKILKEYKLGDGNASDLSKQFDNIRADYNVKQAELSERLGQFRSGTTRQ
jgi:hypothetical protein